MRKIIYTLILFFFWTLGMYAQSSVSLNYLYIGNKEKYAPAISNDLVHNGIGIQGKIHLKNQFYLMPDIGYFFPDYEEKIYLGTTPPNTDSWRENKVRYYVANVNLAYNIPLTKNFSILPFAGVGYFQEYAWMRYGTGNPTDTPTTQEPGGIVMPNAVTEKNNSSSIVCNIGFNMEFYLYKNIFITAGLKYQNDIYNTKYNAFPYINAGIGYSF